MDTNKADILQIKKYLEGKLDARAMHELERRAMDDPFLMDALEGYEAAGNQNKATTQLNHALQQRLIKPQAKVFTLSRLAIAASVITVLGAGVWLLNSRQQVNTAEIAISQPDKTLVAPSPEVVEQQIAINKDSLLAVNTPKAVIRSPRSKRGYREPSTMHDVNPSADETAELASSITYHDGSMEEVMSRKVQQKTDSVPLNEMLVVGMARQRKSNVVGAIASAPSPATKEIKGKVVSSADGEPLPGVTVRAGSTGTVAVTGANGDYTLRVDSLNTNLTYNYIGFRSRQLNAANSGMPGTVALEPETSSLNEVVIVEPADKDGAAHPKNGWESYQKYLNANAVSPNGKKGTYRVSFTVEKDGSLTNFEINKAADDATRQKAIQLIKDGPEWIGNSRKDEKKVITVKFKEAGN